jgi:transcriptional regulator with XRE-family HTH domain
MKQIPVMKLDTTVIPPLSIPNRIRAIRFFSGLNQTELSRLLECSQGTVSKLENGELEPTAFHLVRMREVFGISIDAIVDGLIPYRSIAERFANTYLLPPRYARGAATKMKFLYPLFRAYEMRHGKEKLVSELQRLNVKASAIAEPELLVNAALFHDVIESYRKKEGTEASQFLAAVENCSNEVQASLPSASTQSEEWVNVEKWNLQIAGSDDSAWGARPYANAVVRGIRTAQVKPAASAGAGGFRRVRA